MKHSILFKFLTVPMVFTVIACSAQSITTTYLKGVWLDPDTKDGLYLDFLNDSSALFEFGKEHPKTVLYEVDSFKHEELLTIIFYRYDDTINRLRYYIRSYGHDKIALQPANAGNGWAAENNLNTFYLLRSKEDH